MERVLLQQVKNEQKVSKGGKNYVACSICVDGKWYNGFGNAETQQWKAGDTVTVKLFAEEYNGKLYDKFELLNKNDMVLEELAALRREVQELKLIILNGPKKVEWSGLTIPGGVPANVDSAAIPNKMDDEFEDLPF